MTTLQDRSRVFPASPLEPVSPPPLANRDSDNSVSNTCTINCYTYSNGDTYKGIQYGSIVMLMTVIILLGVLVNGKRVGCGVYKYANGSAYFGWFENNKKHGLGKLVFRKNSSSKEYLGQWKDNKMHGNQPFIYTLRAHYFE